MSGLSAPGILARQSLYSLLVTSTIPIVMKIRPRRDGSLSRSAAGPVGKYVSLPPPVIRIPFDHYIVKADVASPDLIFETLEAVPVDRTGRQFILDEIRYNLSVRMYMPSILLDIFDTGSADISPDQADKLGVIAGGLNRAISRNPAEVFLIEGYTMDYNLSLSVRRAETTAKLLVQQLQVPAENLITQGYVSQDRTSPIIIRRITPLLMGDRLPR